MAGNQKNFSYLTYVDDDGTSWNLRGETGGAATLVDGHAPGVSTQPLWHRTPRNQPRRIRYQDPTTGRTADPVFYTAAAFTAVALGDTIPVLLAGDAAATNFVAIQKVAEKRQGTPAFSHHLADI
jgi:hypothetical protein